MPVLGGSPRQLIRDVDAAIDFSPDGRQFVFQRGVLERDVIEIRIALADGTGERLLATLPGRPLFQYGPTWSLDGKTIAISTLGIGQDVNWGLYVINVADGKVRQLVSSGGRYIGRAIWTPDGNALVATVAETPLGRGQLQSIDFPSGEMHRFTNDLSDYSVALDLTRSGTTLAAIQRSRISDIWIAPAADSSLARQITSGEPAYTMIAPGPSGSVLASSASGDLWLMKTDGREKTMVVPQAHVVLSVAFCGDHSLVFDSYRDGKMELRRTDADGSNGRKTLDEVGSSDCSADGKWIFYVAKDKIYRMSPEEDAPVEVLTVPGMTRAWLLRVSPDGKWIAFVYQEGSPVPVTKLAVAVASGGPLQFTSPLPIGAADLRWAPSGKALDYLLTRSGATNIWEQPLTNEAPRQVTNFPSGRIFGFAWSRDGKQLLVAKGTQASDVILISSFQ
jgi:Tol biopolymer transport system component